MSVRSRGEKAVLANEEKGDLNQLPALSNNTGDDVDLNIDDGDHDRVSPRAIPRKYRLLALSMIIFFNTSSSFSESTLSPLKSTFRKQLGVTSESCSYCPQVTSR